MVEGLSIAQIAAEIAVRKDGENLEHVKPEGLSSPEVYDGLAVNAMNDSLENFAYVECEGLSSKKVYDKLADHAARLYEWAVVTQLVQVARLYEWAVVTQLVQVALLTNLLLLQN